MAIVPVNSEYKTFVRGLVTEAGPLTFPENASIDEENFVLNRKGYRSRRAGLNYESNYIPVNTEFLTSQFRDAAVSVFKWNDVNTAGNTVIVVVQVGTQLFFFDSTAEPVSGNMLNGGKPLDLNLIRNVAGIVEQLQVDPKVQCSYTVSSGRLIVVNNSKACYVITYNEELDAMDVSVCGILVRDQWGVSSGYSPTERRVGFINDAHRYNMWNQGWGAIDSDAGVPYANSFNASLSFWPSDVDRVVSGIDTTNSNLFNPDLIKRAIPGTSESPKGSHIIDIFDRGSSRLAAYENLSLLNNYSIAEGGWDYELGQPSGGLGALLSYGLHRLAINQIDTPLTLSLPTDETEEGVRCVASYGGRVFFSGFSSKVIDGDSKSPNLGMYVAYSQVIDSVAKVGRCYQEADPTSWENFDLVATDGGTIKIPEMSSILKMVPYRDFLLIFARNGVWAISGSSGVFSATDFKVLKISDTGCTSANSIIETEESIIYWAISGIYELYLDLESGAIISRSLTESTIQSYYSSIPYVVKSNATGTYSSTSKTVSYLYSDLEEYENYSDRFRFNRELVLDRSLGSFYKFTFAEDDNDSSYPYIAGIFNPPRFISQIYEENVLDNAGNYVTDSAGMTTIEERLPSSSVLDVSYLLILPPPNGTSSFEYAFTFGSLNDNEFLDFKAYDNVGQDKEAFIETGYELVQGDTQRQKQTNYISVHMEQTEDGYDALLDPINQSSCLMKAKWDFVQRSSSLKDRPSQQVYRLRNLATPSSSSDPFDYEKSVITTKNKVRGRGRALTLRFSTEPAKNCIIYGWGIEFLVNSSI